LSGKTPLLLLEPSLAWSILEGRADVYTVRIREGRPAGARRHLCTLSAGDLIVSLGLSDSGLALQVVGVPGTRVALVDRELLFRPQGLDAARQQEAAAELIDRFLLGLCAGLTRDIAPKPSIRRELESGQLIDLRGTRVLRPTLGVWWLRLDLSQGEEEHASAGALLYLGLEEISPPGLTPFGVLTAQTWVDTYESERPLRVRVLDTRSVLASHDPQAALSQFADLFFRCLEVELRLADVDVLNSIRVKTQAAHRSRAIGLERLGGVLNTGRIGLGSGDDHPLAAACALVARAVGVEIPAIDLRGDERVEDIAAAWGIRHRPVALREHWWLQDGGPLLGFLRDEAPTDGLGRLRPIALLQPKPGRYLAHDPAARMCIRVSTATARRIALNAVSFYRPFPEKPLGVLDLFRYAALGSRRDFLFFLYSGFAIALLAVIPPLGIQAIFSDAIPTANRVLIGEVVAILVVVAISVFILSLARISTVQRLGGRMDFLLEPAIWDRMIRLPTSFHRSQGPGELAEKADGLMVIRKQLASSFLYSVLTGIFAASNLAMLFVFSPQLARPATVILMFGALAAVAINLRQIKSWRVYFVLQGRISSMLVQVFTGIAKIRMSGSEDQVFGLWASAFAKQQIQMLRAGQEQSALLVFNLIFPIASMMALFFVAAGPAGPMVETGSFMAFLAAYTALQTALLSITTAAVALSSVVPVYNRLRPIIETLPEQSGAKVDPGRLKGKIELAEVHFSYAPDGQNILQGVNLEIKPGEFVALVGPSGSGKSTILRLLLGFETPTSGSVRYDDQDLKDLDLFKLRQRNLGVVLQETGLLPGDIFSNIVGFKNMSLEDAWEAARMAGLADDIQAMPLGMHTAIGEGEITLSGGQKQRLSIARALAGDPTILLMDEATSALDNETQHIVSAALDRLRVTRVVIAHRLSTIQNAERILFLDAGRIVESGTYSELMESQGRFHDLIKRQLVSS
jgi:NHLM bacteriocin system ABC transporter ATP-binding protein